MYINWKFVSGALALVLAYDGVVSTVNHKRFEALKALQKRERMRVEYLSQRLEDAGVPMNEFDVIAMQTINQF